MTVVAEHTKTAAREIESEFDVELVELKASSFALRPGDGSTLETAITHARSYGFTVDEVDYRNVKTWLSMGT
jgi:hypothetical protein